MQVSEIISFRHYLLPVPQYWKNLSLEDIDGEIWKPIPDFEGLYEASNLGRIKSLQHGNRYGYVKYKIMSTPIVKSLGRLSITLYKGEIRQGGFVHIWIAKTFVPNPENKETVNHKDGIKLNNTAVNLEWNTMEENNAHAISNGLNIQNGERNPVSKLTNIEVLEIRKLHSQKISCIEIAARFNISDGHVSNIAARRIWKHI